VKVPPWQKFLGGDGQRPLRRQLAITLSVVFSLSILLAVLVLNQLFGWQAKALIDQRSGFFMDSMLAVREYTSKDVNPIVAPLNKGPGIFRPEAVPSYSATTVFEYLKAKPDYKQYSYREAAINPTNLKDKADTFEASIIESLRGDPSRSSISGDRSTPLGNFHYLARPIKVSKESCLACHSTPERAPRSQLLAYGDTNGFGWKLNEIIGAQVVSVPQEAVYQAKRQSLFATALLLVVAFVAVALVTNTVLDHLILRPMRRISHKAEEASVTPSSVSFEEKSRRDEIGLLAQSFERMKQSLAISMQMLKDRQKP
jgi:HAMP domain-containing protein